MGSKTFRQPLLAENLFGLQKRTRTRLGARLPLLGTSSQEDTNFIPYHVVFYSQLTKSLQNIHKLQFDITFLVTSIQEVDGNQLVTVG